ncbi:MAG: hypothetical protein J6Q94_01035 [Clostridia bacterium]|nr:hypothetical protein [Clostridia bacterium]
MEFIQNAAMFIANMIFFGIIDFVVVGGALIAYDSYKQYKEDEPDAEAD